MPLNLCLYDIFLARLVFMLLGEEYHKSGLSFSSHHIRWYTQCQHHFLLMMSTLITRLKEPSARLLHYKITIFPFPHTVPEKQVTKSSPCSRQGETKFHLLWGEVAKKLWTYVKTSTVINKLLIDLFHFDSS